MKLKTKIFLGYFLTMLILLMALLITLWEINDSQKISKRITTLRIPTATASSIAYAGLQHSLSSLRAWVLLGKIQNKNERAQAWQQEITPSLQALNSLSQNWTNPENMQRLKKLNTLLIQFKSYQQEIEDIAHTAANNPSLNLLHTQTAPLAENMYQLISTLINLEEKQKVSSNRKKLLKSFADTRGTLALVLANIRAYLFSGDIQFQEKAYALWNKNSETVNDLNKQTALLTLKQQTAYDSFIQLRTRFEPLFSKTLALRDQIDWNISHHLLATKVAPIADEIGKILHQMKENQHQLLKADQARIDYDLHELIFLEWVLIVFGLFISTIICWLISQHIKREVGGDPSEIMVIAKKIANGDVNFEDQANSQSATGILASLYLIANSQKQISHLAYKIADGNYTNNITPRSDVDMLGTAMQRMTDNLRNIVHAAKSIADNDLTVQIKTLGKNDDLGIAMQQMTENLRIAADKTNRNTWIQTGQVLVAKALRENQDIQSLGENLLNTLSAYVNAQLGTIYRWVEATETESSYLELSASYAYTAQQNTPKRFQLGEGLVGQAATENKVIRVNQVPDNYLSIQSSLGHSTPKNLILIPFNFYEELSGVLELGFVNEIDDQTTELLTSLREPIGAAFENMVAQMHLEASLKASLALESAIRISEKRTTTILESSLISIITINTQGIIESCNATTEAFFGYSKQEMMGNNIKMLMPESRALEHDGYLKNYQNTGEAKVIGIGREVIAKRKNGSEFPIHLSVTEMPLGDSLTFLGTITDISDQVEQREKINKANMELQASTEELASQQEKLRLTNESLNIKTKELEQQKQSLEIYQQELETKASELVESNQYKSEFLANMSHELRTPLNSLLILAKFLADNDNNHLSDDEVESAQIIHESGNNLLQLINDILDLSKVESGHMIIHTDTISLIELQHFLNTRFKHMAEAKGITFEINVQPEMPDFFISDYTKLGQILTNLISNALKFTETGSVTLNMSLVISDIDSNTCLSFIVTDTGIGIPQDKQQAVFEAFQQADGSTNRQYGGTGLGLSIALSFAKLLNGIITLTSEVEKGSQFTLNIPYIKPSEDLQSNIEPQQVISNSKESTQIQSKETAPAFKDDRDNLDPSKSLFLLIEDDATFAKNLMKVCHQQKVQVLHAPNGETGINLAKQYKLTGIILDYMLPGLDGGDVLAILQSDNTTRHIPVHIISAVDDLINMNQLGAIGQLTKPVSKTQILSVLDHLRAAHDLNELSLLIVEDDETGIAALKKLLSKEPINISIAKTGTEAILTLQTQKFSALILDLGLPDMSGIELLETLSQDNEIVMPAVIIYSGQDLTDEEHQKIQHFTSSVIIKSVKSPERLLDEIHLFIDPMSTTQHQALSHNPQSIDLDHFKGKQLLLVDDDMRNTFSLAKVLRSKALEVKIAPSGQDGLNALDEHPDFDLVLMDIMMPDMDGYETMQRIRAQQKFKELPIIALTANAMRGDKEKCLASGANDYLAKPVDIEKLLVQIQMWL